MTRFFFVLLLGYLPSIALCQLDTVHYFPPFFANEAQGEQFIFLSTPSVQAINIEIRTPQGNLIRNVSISNANPDYIYFGNDDLTRLMIQPTQLGVALNTKGLVLRSDREFYCNYRITSNDGFHSGSITCKGEVAKGRIFRPGHMITSNAFIQKSNTVSMMALEDATVTISNLPPGLDLANVGVTNGTEIFTLNQGQTLTLSAIYFLFNPNDTRGFFGSLIESTGDLVINCGSHTGGILANNLRDIGIDQIVPMNALGDEYILVRGNGTDQMENVMVMIHEDNTEVNVNGLFEGVYNAGEYVVLDAFFYSNSDNMYISTNNNVAVYQMIGGLPDTRTYGMNFIPPVSCLGEPDVNNIPYYNSIDDFTYTGNIIIIARVFFPVSINGIQLPLNLARPVPGNPDYVTYKISNDLGVDHIRVTSAANVQVGLMGGNDAIGFAGYFSGFERYPKAIIADLDSINGFCLDSLRALGTYEKIDWYYLDSLIAIDQNVIPSYGPGEYYAVGYFVACPDVRDTTRVFNYPLPDTTYINIQSCFPSDTGMFIRQLESVKRCDSFVLESISLLPSDSLTAFEVTCNPEEAGLDTLYFQNRFGCDSIVYQTTSLLRRDTLGETFFVCDLQDARTDTIIFTNSVGCDSIRYETYQYVGLDTLELEVEICQGDEFTFEGQFFRSTGTYCFDYASFYGCDSIRCLQLNVLPSYQSSILDTICEEEIYVFSGDSLYGNGLYEFGYQTLDGCDSLILLELIQLPKPNINIDSPVPFCLGDTLSIDVNNGSGFNLRWQDLNMGVFPRNFESGGSYYLEYEDADECLYVDTLIIPDPIVIDIQALDLSDYNDFGVSCAGGNDGFIELATEGGRAPYRYFWNNQENSERRSNLSAGTYHILAMDATGCMDSIEVSLDEPPVLEMGIEAINIDCVQDFGQIIINYTNGGVPPYINLFEGVPSDIELIDSLSLGRYELVLQDANGCTFVQSIEISDETDLLNLNIVGPDSIDIGDSITLFLKADDRLSYINWSAPDLTNCQDCQSIHLRPLRDQQVILEAINEKGCSSRASFNLYVDPTLRIYIPNSFSPNGDGTNDFFVVFGNPSVRKINSYRIFDRWGDLIYENYNLDPNTNMGYWDGNFKGNPMNPAVFVYVVEVEYINGAKKVFSGDVTLWR